jgi:hypothetical protein
MLIPLAERMGFRELIERIALSPSKNPAATSETDG